MRWFGRKQKVEQLVSAFYQPLYRYAYRLSGSPQEAEDLTQEAFCQAQNKLGQLRDESRAKAWLFSILRNAYLHRLHHYTTMRNRGTAELRREPLSVGAPLRNGFWSRVRRRLRGDQPLATIDDPLTAMQFRAFEWIVNNADCAVIRGVG